MQSSTVSIVTKKLIPQSIYDNINLYFIYLGDKEKVVEMHKEVIKQLIQQQRKRREEKAAEEVQRGRFEMEQREAAKKVEQERLAEQERSSKQL